MYQFPGQARKHTSRYLHHRASNNVAELHGILTACNRIRADLPDALAQIPQVFIFVDNNSPSKPQMVNHGSAQTRHLSPLSSSLSLTCGSSPQSH